MSQENGSRKDYGQWLGVLLALVALVWVLYNIHPERLLRDIRQIRWAWVALAIFIDSLAPFFQSLRWMLLLMPITRLPVLKFLQAIYVGLFTNELLPMRSGELVRGYLVVRWGDAELSGVISSIAIERLFDGLILASIVVVISIFFPLPKSFQEAGKTLGITLLVIIGLLIFLAFRGKRLRKDEVGGTEKWRPLQKVTTFLASFLDSFGTIGKSRHWVFSLLISFMIPLCQMTALWAMFLAYHLNLSFAAAIVVLSVMNLGTMIPNAPANIGSYQFFCVLGLSLFGVEKAQAAEFSIVVFILLSLPFLLFGFIALILTGLGLKDLRAKVAGFWQRKKSFNQEADEE